MKDKDPTPEELRTDLAQRMPGLEQLAGIPGVVPTGEEAPIAPGEERFERVFGTDAPTPIGRAEFWRVLLLLFALAIVPLAEGLFRTDRVTFGLDQARHAEPWASALRAEGVDLTAKNQGLSDQAVNFYPFYRWVSRSLLEGDAPLWNPLIYCGAPGLGNPQAGVLDPQVWALVAGEALGGLPGFHLAMNWVACLRLVVAGLGAYFLARRLGLRARGALAAALTFQFSGYLVLWLNFPLGHVPPFLPWVLYFVEGCVPRRLEGTASAWPARRAFLGAAACMALAILGGHPETSFFVGLTAGLWALALLVRDRKAGLVALGALALGSLVASPALLAFWRYLQVSGAMMVRRGEQADVGVAPLALGLCLLVVLGAVGARRLWRGATEAAEGQALARGFGGAGLVWAASLVLLAGALLWGFALGLEERVFLSLVHDYWGHPGRGGFHGPGTGLLETGSTWLVTAAWLGAAASLVTGRTALRGRGLVIGIGGVAMGLALGVPGLLELYRQLPLVGLGDTVRFAPVGALMVGLLAGEGLERADAKARLFACVPFAALLVVLGIGLTTAPAYTPRAGGVGVSSGPEGEVPGPASWVTEARLSVRPGERLDARAEQLAGYYVSAEPSAGARLVLTRRGAAGEALETSTLPLDFVGAPPSGPAVSGARHFRTSTFQTSRMTDGAWDLTLVFDPPSAGAAPVVVDLGSHLKVNEPELNLRTWLLILAVLGAFLAGPRGVPVVLALACLQALDFAAGQNPTYAAAEVFPETHTERLLAAELGPHRFFSELGVLPPDTGLVRGLRALDGYDAIDPATYSEMRRFALQPGKHPLLAWHARGVDLDSPVWRMLGVKFLLFNAPMEPRAGAERWELVACPRASEGVPFAEVWIYRARDPFPRAWAVTELAQLEPVLSAVLKLRSAVPWDPRRTALMAADGGDWPWPLAGEGSAAVARPASPATQLEVGTPRLTNMRVTVDVAVDGDALLVLSEQYFPGAWFEVDGERRAALQVNGLFVACELRAGDEEVVLRR